MVILGAGTLGCEAAKFARGLGAHVVVLDNDINALRRVQTVTPDEVPTMIATRPHIEKAWPLRISWCARSQFTVSARPFW